MPQIINTNIASLSAQRNLNNSQSANTTALERLSSGLRINSAKDDAAGLAISTKFESQIKGINVAIRNAGDGISLAQTAEGSLGAMTENLQRVRELAVQSSNATNSDEDRVAIQAEVSQLMAEVSRTAEETNFNGRNLLDGTFSGTFQIGANAGNTVEVNISELTADKLGSSEQSGVSAMGTDTAIGNGDLIINGVAIGASRAEDDTSSTSNADASAIAKAAAVNRHSDETGVTAVASENSVAGTVMVGAATAGSIDLNGVNISMSTSTDTGQTRAGVLEAINGVSDQTGITATDSGSDAGGVTLTAADGRNIDIAFTGVTAAASGLAATDTYESGFTLVAKGETKEIAISGGNGTGNGDITNTGLAAGSYDRGVASTVNTAQTSTQAAATVGGGTFADTVTAAATNVTTNETALTVKVGDTETASVLATGSEVQDLAAAVNGTAGITAWEEITLSVTASTLATGDTMTLTGSGGAGIVTSSGTAGDLKTLTADINATDFTATDMDVFAEFDGTNMSVTIRNFGSQEVGFVASANDMTSAAGALNGNVATGVLAFASDDGQDVSVALADPVTGGELMLGNDSSSEYTGVNGLADGDLNINGVNISAADSNADKGSAEFASDGVRILSSEKSGSAISIADAINKTSDETGVTATTNATTVVGGDGTTLAGYDLTNIATAEFNVGNQAGLYINGVSLGDVTLQADGTGDLDTDKAKTDTISLINSKAGQTGVTAIDNGTSISLEAADGRNISVAIDDKSGSSSSIGAVLGLDAGDDGIGESTFGFGTDANATISAEATTYETTYSTVELSSASEFSVGLGSNGKTELEAMGFTSGKFGGGEDGTFLKDIDVSTFQGAQDAITALDNALKTVSSQRAELGALQNRFESTSSNLQVTSENLSAANSRIRDADFATETAELSRTQVLQQAGISILAQANQRPQQVLSLLG